MIIHSGTVDGMSHCLQQVYKLGISATKPCLVRASVHLNLSTFSSYRYKPTKEPGNILPKARFPGKCILISSPATEELKYRDQILSLVSNTKVLGFDTESKPSFYSRDRKTISPPCLVQLANDDLCVMWRLQKAKTACNYVGANFPPLLHSILTDKDILKVGHSSKDDALLLLTHYNINMCSVFDTYNLVNFSDFNLERKSLKGLTGSLLGLSLDKCTRMSNWEQEELTEKQVAYACTDAWVSLQTYKSLVSVAKKRRLRVVSPIEETLPLVTKPQERRKLAKLVTTALSQRAKLDSSDLKSQHFPKIPLTRSESKDWSSTSWLSYIKTSMFHLLRLETSNPIRTKEALQTCFNEQNPSPGRTKSHRVRKIHHAKPLTRSNKQRVAKLKT